MNDWWCVWSWCMCVGDCDCSSFGNCFNGGTCFFCKRGKSGGDISFISNGWSWSAWFLGINWAFDMRNMCVVTKVYNFFVYIFYSSFCIYKKLLSNIIPINFTENVFRSILWAKGYNWVEPTREITVTDLKITRNRLGSSRARATLVYFRAKLKVLECLVLYTLFTHIILDRVQFRKSTNEENLISARD